MAIFEGVCMQGHHLIGARPSVCVRETAAAFEHSWHRSTSASSPSTCMAKLFIYSDTASHIFSRPSLIVPSRSLFSPSRSLFLPPHSTSRGAPRQYSDAEQLRPNMSSQIDSLLNEHLQIENTSVITRCGCCCKHQVAPMVTLAQSCLLNA